MQAFVGRQAQLLELDRHLAAGLAGQTSVCLVTGEPGAGKSSLLAEFTRRAQQAHPQLLVAKGICDAYTGVGDPYLPFREILGELTGGDAPQSTSDAIEPTTRMQGVMRFAANALAEHGPDLIDIFVPGGAIVTRLGASVVGRTAWGRRRTEAAENKEARITAQSPTLKQDNIFEQYTQVLIALSNERPVLLIVDDLHWVDSGSVGLLFHLARRLADAPVLIVGAYRRAEVGGTHDGGAHGLAGLVAELQRIHGDIEVRLDDNNGREFVEALADEQGAALDTEFREALARHSAGNALFAVELLRSLEDSGALQRDASGRLRQVAPPRWDLLPSKIIGVIETRIRRLNDGQRNLLSAACVQGEVFTADVLAPVVAAERRAVIKELSGPLQKEHELVTAIGLQETGGINMAAYRFRHNLVQDHLYRALDAIERAELHRDTGLALERLVGEDPAAAVRIASHFIRAEQWDKGIQYSVLAGESAARQLAPHEAIRHLEFALDSSQRKSQHLPAGLIDIARVSECLADQLLLLARLDDAAARYQQSLALSQLAGPVTRARLLRRLAFIQERLTKYPEALALLDEALTALGPAPTELPAPWWEEWIDIELGRSGVHYWRSDADAMAQVELRLRPEIERWGTPLQRGVFHAEIARRGLRRTRYQPDLLIRTAARAAAVSVAGRSLGSVEAECVFVHAFVEMWAGHHAAAATILESLLESVSRSGDVTQQFRSLTYLALAYRRLDDPAAVAALNERGRSFANIVGQESYAGMLLAQDAWVAWRRGDGARARELNASALDLWRERAARYPFQFPAFWLGAALGLEDGEPRRAASCALRSLETSQARPGEELENLLAAVLDAVATDDQAAIRQRVEQAVALARQLHII
jgi:tetratricopeptide (TPR) repeat protein